MMRGGFKGGLGRLLSLNSKNRYISNFLGSFKLIFITKFFRD